MAEGMAAAVVEVMAAAIVEVVATEVMAEVMAEAMAAEVMVGWWRSRCSRCPGGTACPLYNHSDIGDR